jgi:hypothetical protein
MSRDDSPAARAEEFLRVFARGAEFTRDLLGENQHLREECQALRERLGEAEAEGVRLADRGRDAHQENDTLAHLYVAGHQLHSTLDFDEVVQNVIEIAINLIGADAFAIYLLDERTGELAALTAVGATPAELPRIQIDRGPLGRTVAGKRVVYWEAAGSGDPSHPIAWYRS